MKQRDNVIIEGSIKLDTGDVRRLMLKKVSCDLTVSPAYRLEVYDHDDSSIPLIQASLDQRELSLLSGVINLVTGR